MFFERLKRLCKIHNTSPTKLVVTLGLSKSNVTNWKNGVIPNTDVVKKIADYFSVSVDYLLTSTEKPDIVILDENGKPKAVIEVKSDLEKVIIERSPTPLPEDVKKELMDHIDATIDTFLKAYNHERNNK